MRRRIFMNEPWIDPGILGGILGGTIGILGSITGGLAGWFVPKGKAKKLVLGVIIFLIALSLILLVIGIIAYLFGQPRGVWYGFGYTGLLGTIIFGILYPVLLNEYRKAELRKSMAEDLTLGENRDVGQD
jgi:hypothetical protein